jgi:hypothetical protein
VSCGYASSAYVSLPTQDGFEVVCSRAEDGEKFYTSFHKIVAKLNAVESKYVKGLSSLKQLFSDSQSMPTR